MVEKTPYPAGSTGVERTHHDGTCVTMRPLICSSAIAVEITAQLRRSQALACSTYGT
jgi:hypothetical protein